LHLCYEFYCTFATCGFSPFSPLCGKAQIVPVLSPFSAR